MKYVAALAAILTAATVPAFAHETGIPHEGSAVHPILGLDHMLIVVAIATAVGTLAFWRR